MVIIEKCLLTGGNSVSNMGSRCFHCKQAFLNDHSHVYMSEEGPYMDFQPPAANTKQDVIVICCNTSMQSLGPY